MSVKAFIVGKETSLGILLKRLLDTYAMEAGFVQKTPPAALLSSAELLVFLESAQAEEWTKLPRRLLPALLLPESFPPPLPLKKLAEANIRLMPRETDAHVLETLFFLDAELHRFSKSISDLSEENQQAMLSLFEEFRLALGDAALQIQELLPKQAAAPHSKEALSQIRAVAHRLAGSTGSYGLMALSKAAKTLEGAIEKHKPPEIQTLINEFLEMLSLFLPPTVHAPLLSKTLFIHNPGQQARSRHTHRLRSLGVHALWGMDWVECWKAAQHPLDGAVLSVDNLPLESWPGLFEALGSAPGFAALPKLLLKQHASDAEKACAAQLNCLGPSTPPATFEELKEIVQALF